MEKINRLFMLLPVLVMTAFIFSQAKAPGFNNVNIILNES